MALNFPQTPEQGDIYEADNGVNYLFDGIKWMGSANHSGGSGGSSTISYNDLINKPSIPSDVSDLTDTENLLDGGTDPVFNTVTANNGLIGPHTDQVGYRFSDYVSGPAPVSGETNTYRWIWMDTSPTFPMNQIVAAFQSVGANNWTIYRRNQNGDTGTVVNIIDFQYTPGSNKILKITTSQAMPQPYGYDSATLTSPDYAQATASNLTLIAGTHTWTLGTDGTFNLPLAVNGKGVIQTTGDYYFDADGAIYNFGADGAFTFPDGTVQNTAYQTTTAPSTSKGVSGNKAGMVAFDSGNFYYCKTDYTNGAADIWVKTAWTGTSW
jgi:hypothetical protein